MKLLGAKSCPTLWDPMDCSPPVMEFSRQEYWSGKRNRTEYCSGSLFPSPGDLPNQGTKPGSPALHTDSLPTEPPGKPKMRYSPQIGEHPTHLLGPIKWCSRHPWDQKTKKRGREKLKADSLLLKPGLENFEHYFTIMLNYSYSERQKWNYSHLTYYSHLNLSQLRIFIQQELLKGRELQ